MEIGTNNWSNFLIDHAKSTGIEFNCIQNRLFSAHAAELIKWNRKINLTTITDPTDVVTNHFLDSLVPARFIPPKAAMLDIGSGAGFPGIPLKVLLPELSVTLIDASRKKVNFLKHVIRTLKLKDIEALHVRAEDLAEHPSYIHRFDVIISRALTSLKFFVRLALPLLACGGLIIALKGEVGDMELADLRNNTLTETNSADSVARPFAISLERYSLPFILSKRTIVILRQKAQCLMNPCRESTQLCRSTEFDSIN
jgi:16S rRNA (guanine527-N7)-methyltransferase